MLRTIRQIKHFSGCYRRPFLISAPKMSFTKSIKQLEEIINDIEKSMDSKPVQQKTKQQKVQEPVDEAARAKELFATAHIQVSKIIEAEKHPKADSLVKLQIDTGSDTRQIIAGIYKHYNVEELKNRLILTILNLKPAKLVGEMSNGMLLAASDENTTKKGLVRLLEPPEGSKVGDRVFLEGTEIKPPAERVNAKNWGRIVEQLSVQDGKATCAKIPLMTNKGYVLVPKEIPDGSEIH